MQIDAQIDVALELRYLDVGEGCKGLASPLAPAAILHGQEGLLETRGQAEALTPFGRWCRVQTCFVAPPAVAQDQVHIAQGNGRGSALLVGPHYRAMADDEFRLRENVVEHTVIGLPAAGEVEPGHIYLAFNRAPDVEGRCVHV